MKLFRVLDPFTLTLVVTVLLASFFPAQGSFVGFFEGLTTAAIALLFFMHGAKLSREAIIAGSSHWRLHLRAIPGAGRVVRLVGSGQCQPGDLYRLFVSVYFACHSAIGDCVYFPCRWQRGSGRLCCLCFKPAGYFPLPAIGGHGDACSWRERQFAAGRQHYDAVTGAVCCRPSISPLDW